MNNNEQETITIESLEGEWVGYEEGESSERWSRQYFASIEEGKIKIEFKNWGLQSQTESWWYGSFSTIESNIIVSDGMPCEEIEERDRYSGSKMSFKYEEKKLSTLEIQTFDHNEITNPYIYFEKVG